MKFIGLVLFLGFLTNKANALDELLYPILSITRNGEQFAIRACKTVALDNCTVVGKKELYTYSEIHMSEASNYFKEAGLTFVGSVAMGLAVVGAPGTLGGSLVLTSAGGALIYKSMDYQRNRRAFEFVKSTGNGSSIFSINEGIKPGFITNLHNQLN